MSRTPLFRLIRRSLRLAQVSLRTGMPAGEVVDCWRETPKVSRRYFLGTTAVTAAGLAAGCGRFPDKSSSSSGTSSKAASAGEVLIVGAGIAGLTAGYRLTQKGVPVRILEAQNRTGGRMHSLRDFFPEKQVVELGGELIDTNHESIQALASELGLALDDFNQDDSKLARDVWFFDGRRYSDAEVVEAFRPIAAKIDEAWETVTGEVVTYKEPNNGQAIDNLSIAAWLDEAGAEGWFRKLLDVAYTTEYGLEIDQQSAWNFLMMIDSNPEPFRIFGDSDERFHVRGGNDQIPTALAKKLEGRIQTGTRLEAITQAADKTYRCSVRRGQTSETISAEHVLLAIPFTLLRQVRIDVEMPPVKRRAIKELGYGTNAKLMVGFSERLWRTTGGSNGSVLTDLPFQLTWEATRMQPGKSGVLVDFTGGQHGVDIGQGTPAHQAELFAADLERIFPGVAERRLGEALFHWPSFPYTRGSYACYLPGQWTGFGGAEIERVGNLHFAGEHCSADFQGFMEGGCETGERAAAEILADLGIPQEEEKEKAA
ncbi:MAG TPA: FAD-dependent oxidoreductase [Thermoanaerobaculia bacterium]|nr:FAD-dependent oxidoreductase [Thermoanaerobaculia bacterium]